MREQGSKPPSSSSDTIYTQLHTKSQDEETVHAKRAAVRVLVRELLGEEDFVGQKWGYVIAYESDIRASESWEDLKRKSNPGA